MLNEQIMENNGVGLVLLFGSAAARQKHPLSDTDIGVVFTDARRRLAAPVAVYDELLAASEEKFKSKIDLVYLEEAPLSLQYRAVSEGKILYEAKPGLAANYKEKVLKHYFDFQYAESIFRQGLLAR